jgi:hypothetical protein
MIFITALNTALGGGEVHLQRLFSEPSAMPRQPDGRPNVHLIVRSNVGPLTKPPINKVVSVFVVPACWLPKRVVLLAKLLRTENAEVIHMNALPRDLDVLLASTIVSARRKIIHLHAAQFGRELPNLKGNMAKLLLAVMRSLIRLTRIRFFATSQKAMSSFWGYPNQAYVWAPPVLRPSSPIGPCCLQYPKSDIVQIAYIGRFHRSAVYEEPKNFELVVDILQLLFARQANRVTLVSIGNGNSIEVFRNKLAMLGEHHEHILSCDDPWRYVPCGAIVLVPSRHEGFSLVAAEAQQRGLRTIVSSAIPEEAIYVPELVSRLSAGASAIDWVETILQVHNVSSLEILQCRTPPAEMTISGHWQVATAAYKEAAS